MRSCSVEPCRQEFQLRNCCFENVPPDEMVRSQWQSRTTNVYYLMYRWTVAIFYVVSVALTMSNIRSWREFGLYWIYLTDWGILLCMTTAIFGAVLVTMWFRHSDFADKIQSANKMPFSFECYWALHNVTITLSCVITIIYWAILHNNTKPLDAINYMTHVTNSAVMLLDVMLVAHPIRLYHVYQPLTVGLLFVWFSLVYYWAGGVDWYGNSYIYPVLDWTKPDQAIVTSLGTFLLSVVVHIVLFLVHKLRVCLHSLLAQAGKHHWIGDRNTMGASDVRNDVVTVRKVDDCLAEVSLALEIQAHSNGGFSENATNVV